MIEKITFNNKVENNGVNQNGRLTAAEFNAVINTVNALIESLGGVSICIVESEEAYNAISDKDESTLYFILAEE